MSLTTNARFVLPAGGTGVGAAPLKLTSGSLLSAAEAGAVEFLTDKFYVTISTGPVRKELGLYDTYYGGMYVYSGVGTTTVEAQTEYHAVAAIVTAGLLNGWAFTAGVKAPVASVAENVPTVSYKVTTTGAHNLSAGDIVTHNGFTVAAYKGVKTVLSAPSGTEYTVAGTYSATDTGVVRRGSRLVAGANTAGIFLVNFSTSVSAETNTTVFKFEVNKNLTAQDNIVTEKMCRNANDLMTASSSGLVSIAAGDVLWLSMANLTDASDFTMKHGNLVVIRV